MWRNVKLIFCTHCVHMTQTDVLTRWNVNVCIGTENLMKSSYFWKLFSAGLNIDQVHGEETDNLWGIKMSLFLMLRQWQGINTLFENSWSHFFGVNLKPSWKDDALIRLDSLLNPGINPTLLLIGQPTWAWDTFARIPQLLFHHYTPNPTRWYPVHN